MVLSALIFEAPERWPLALALGVVLTAAVLWLYPPQLRGAGSLAWAAAALRWVAVSVLALALLKPVLLLPKTAKEMGAVLVLVDCSKSMGITDVGRTPAEQVALASALGHLPLGVRADVTAPLGDGLARVESRVQEVLGALSDFDYARVSGRGITSKQAAVQQAAGRYAAAARQLAALAPALPPGTELRALIARMDQVPRTDAPEQWAGVKERVDRANAAARNLQRATDEQLYKSDPQVRAVCAMLAKMPRLKLAEDALLRPGSGLTARLGPNIPVAAMAIDGGLQPIALMHDGKPAGAIAVKAEDDQSDLGGAVTAALSGQGEPGGAPGRAIRSVVLFSDGRQVGGRPGVTSAVRPAGIPVLTVGMAPPQTPDVWISNVLLSSTSAFAGETIEGQVTVRYEGVKPPAKLHVTSSSGEFTGPLSPRSTGGPRGRANELIGRFALTVHAPKGDAEEKLVFWVPVMAGEATGANNRVERRIKVSSARVRVAVCTAAPTWDFQYLRGALRRQPWVQLQSEVLNPVHPRLGLSPAEILGYDVLVLDDVPADALDVGQWDAIHTLVNSRGGTVVLIAGSSYPLADYARQPIARGLLPFHDVRPAWKQWPGEQPAFHFAPTPLGQEEMPRLADGPDGGLRRWQELPAVYRYLQVPDADFFPDVRRLLLEADSGSAVLTERPSGAGRVLFLGLDETWRWRLKSRGPEAGRFWRQLVRYAAGQPYAAGNGPFALDLDHVEVRPGQTVRVRARIGAAKSPPPTARTCPLDILRGGKLMATHLLRATGGGHFEAALTGLPPGDYQLQIHGVAAGPKPLAVRVPLHVVQSDEAEMRDISGDPQMLQRIARSSGGEYFTIDQADRLPGRLAGLGGRESRSVRHALWNSPFVFTFVLACLAGEWALRKRVGLA